jgi:hypothetical protein
VTNLVTGRQYGVTDALDLPLGKGIVYGFQITGARPEFVGVKADESGRVRVDFKSPCDTVVSFRVFRPDGTEAECYAKKVVVKGDCAEMSVPFSMSDVIGKWRVTAKDVLGGDVGETSILR